MQTMKEPPSPDVNIYIIIRNVKQNESNLSDVVARNAGTRTPADVGAYAL